MTVPSKPADFTTAPSGASEPCRIVSPPVAWIGEVSSRMTPPSTAGGSMSARFSASVLPVTVRQSPCISPASSSAFITIGMPPTRSRSTQTYLPKGLTSAEVRDAGCRCG